MQTQKRRRRSGIEGAGVGNKRAAGPRGLGHRNRASSSVSSDGSAMKGVVGIVWQIFHVY